MDIKNLLPSTPQEWKAFASKRGIEDSTIHTVKLKSASKIKEDQFLLLRVLWKINEIGKFDWKRFGLEEWQVKAEALLANYPSWNTYCNNWAMDADSNHESTFALARYFQFLATETSQERLTSSVTFTPIANRTRNNVYPKTPTKSTGVLLDNNDLETELESDDGDDDDDDDDDDDNDDADDSPLASKSPAPEEVLHLIRQTKDEQIVNTALVNFLSALTLHAHLPSRWTLHRKSFKARFEQGSFEARTDGYLEDKTSHEKVQALIEVKPVRKTKRKGICMQEAAQMVAWILSYPDQNVQLNQPNRRLHLIQDRHEMYIVIAEYTTDYIRYLKNDSMSDMSDAYMTMHEFGPWDTMNLKHIKNVAVIIVAIVLQAGSQ